MKKFILSLAVMFSCLAAFGQREIISMDWDVVKDFFSLKRFFNELKQ